MREDRTSIGIDKATSAKLSHICDCLGKSRNEIIKVVIDALYEEAKSFDHANLKVLKTPFDGVVMFSLSHAETFVLPIKAKGDKK